MSHRENSYIIVFESYNQAILLYNELLKKGCSVELVSTPCSISKGCSQSIIFRSRDSKEIIKESKNNKIIIKGIYRIIHNDGIHAYIHI
ncbi:DUF3343 domain-containing protein [Clostridium sp. DJ247]|uniref:DUF3343 domain-containing protein n=1 Tax=Clostridium sp. DJ247 TaxID=2726188 RepID=UPI00162601C0|nr:DUF3343 domain-containing protein [Clostridium sp. DJ247]MBC2580272.1 DUF3343 domain-containing protein [Clostridium sp. DJ247]